MVAAHTRTHIAMIAVFAEWATLEDQSAISQMVVTVSREPCFSENRHVLCHSALDALQPNCIQHGEELKASSTDMGERVCHWKDGI